MRRAFGRAVVVVVVVLTAAAVGAGCGPSDVCKRYVACQKAYDPSVDTSAYDDGGSCWGTLPSSNTCSDQCRDALFALSQVKDAPPECVDEGAETDAGSG